MESKDKAQMAVETFNGGFNCAQAVFSALAQELGLERETALKIAACFGGGMRCGEVCGAVSGALMAIGLKDGYYMPDDKEGKAASSAKAREFIARFKDKNHTVICREILGHDPSLPEGMQKIREGNLFSTVCPGVVADAVKIASGML